VSNIGYLFFGETLGVVGGDYHADGIAGQHAHREKDEKGDNDENYY
jgi:hypothetical protein